MSPPVRHLPGPRAPLPGRFARGRIPHPTRPAWGRRGVTLDTPAQTGSSLNCTWAPRPFHPRCFDWSSWLGHPYDLRHGGHAISVQDEQHVVARRRNIAVGRCRDGQCPRLALKSQAKKPLAHIERVGSSADANQSNLGNIGSVWSLHREQFVSPFVSLFLTGLLPV